MYYKIFNVDPTQCHLFKGIQKNCRHDISWSRISKSDQHCVLCLVLFKYTIRSVTLTRNRVNSAGSRCNTAVAETRSSIQLLQVLEQYCLCQINNLKVQLLQAGGRRSGVLLGISHPRCQQREGNVCCDTCGVGQWAHCSFQEIQPPEGGQFATYWSLYFKPEARKKV